MLYIDDTQAHIQAAKKKHCALIICYVNRKLYGDVEEKKCNDSKCKVCTSSIRKVSDIDTNLIEIIKKIDLSKLIGGNPKEIYELDKSVKNDIEGKFANSELLKLKTIFNYEWFIDKQNNKYNAYDLCEGLRIETCVYCNRLYTSTVFDDKKGNKIIRPTLDHWFSQEEYPILALSFYNLIPSCSPCNTSVKHTAKFKLEEHIHPYVNKGIEKLYTLKCNYNSKLNKFKIVIDTKDISTLKTLTDMQIGEIYSHHQSELRDLDFLKRKYSKAYLQSLKNTLGKNLSVKDVYRLLLWVEYDDGNFHKLPMSKLKKDILDIDLDT